jgi:nitrogen regulatory protein P-II 1
MKKIEALIHPGKIDDVKAALLSIAVIGLTITEVRMPDSDPNHGARYRGAMPSPGFVGQLKCEIVVPDWKASQVVEAVRRAARTGQAVDGLASVLPMDAAMRIRTGERGEDAL